MQAKNYRTYYLPLQIDAIKITPISKTGYKILVNTPFFLVKLKKLEINVKILYNKNNEQKCRINREGTMHIAICDDEAFFRRSLSEELY